MGIYQRLDVSRYSKFLTDVSGNLILVEFSGILKLVESSEFLRCGVDFNGNLGLVGLGGFPRL